MRRVRRYVLAMAPLLALCGMLMVGAGTASASVNVVDAIHTQDRVVGESTALQRLRHLHANDPRDAKKLIAPIETLAHRFERSASVVAGSSADSATQRVGRRDWVSGVRIIAAGFYRLGHALREITTGNASGAQKLLLSAERKVVAGQKLGFRADRLLGIHHGD